MSGGSGQAAAFGLKGLALMKVEKLADTFAVLLMQQNNLDCTDTEPPGQTVNKRGRQVLLEKSVCPITYETAFISDKLV